MNKGLEHTHADIIYEAAVLYAVPSVLKRGTVVGRENNHGGNGQRTVTFAAPIELTVGENRYRVNMGVVVIEERKNYYHSHQVLMPDGSVLQLGETRKTSPIPAVASPKNGDVVAPISDVSTSIINGEDSGVKLSSNAIGREDGEGDLLEAAVPVYDVTPNAQKQAGTQGSLLDAVTESTESAPAAENGERRAVAGYYGEEYAN